MKKTVLFSLLMLSQLITWAQQSVYTLRPDDSEAVYFTQDHFRISGDGKTDVTQELQRAINEVKEKYNFGIVFIPEGKYMISSTLYVPKAVRLIGYGKNRPVIFLKKNAPGFQEEPAEDKGKARYMFWFTDDVVKPGTAVRDAGAGTFYSALSNIDLRIEDGNPCAVALRTHFAQHSFISHVQIFAGNGKAGLFDVGNEMEDVQFYGGEYGIYTTKTSPSWQMMMMNVTFKGQRKACIKTQEGGLTMVGVHFQQAPTAISVNEGKSDKIYLENCTFQQLTHEAILLGNEEYSPNQLSVRNSFCQKVNTFLRLRESGKQVTAPATSYVVNELTYGLHQDNLASLPYTDLKSNVVKAENKQTLPASPIPALPAMEKWVNIQEFGAIGDGITDNTAIIQKAIDTHEVIYFPQGWYIVSNTIKLKKNTKLIGLNPISTQLKLRESTPAFSGFGTPVPLLESSEGGENLVNGIGLNTGAYNYRAVGCKWMAGADSYMNDVKFLGIHGDMPKGPRKVAARRNTGPAISTPENPVAAAGKDLAWDNQHWSLWITQNGGGTFKDIWTANSYATSGLYISHTATPGNMYAVSVEHHVRNEVRFNDVQNWNFYALQLEEETRESPDCQQIEMQECKNLMFANLYLFRVIRLETPFPYAIRSWNNANVTLYNLHNFTQMRFTTDMVAYDMNTRREIRPWEMTKVTLVGNEGRTQPFAGKSGTMECLAHGFEYAEGITADSKGNVYFSEQRMRRVYRWDAEKETLTLVCDLPWQPISLAVDTQDRLLVFCKYYPQPGFMTGGKQETIQELPDAAGTTFSHWGNSGFALRVYAIDPLNAEATMQPLSRVPMASVRQVKRTVYPTHRWRDLHDFQEVCEQQPAYCFLAPDGVTVIPEQYDFLRSSSVQMAAPGQQILCADEYNHLTAKLTVTDKGTLKNFSIFAKVGEFGCTWNGQDAYIADGYIYVLDAQGNRKKVQECPERPTALITVGDYLYVAARSSLYRMKIN